MSAAKPSRCRSATLGGPSVEHPEWVALPCRRTVCRVGFVNWILVPGDRSGRRGLAMSVHGDRGPTLCADALQVQPRLQPCVEIPVRISQVHGWLRVQEGPHRHSVREGSTEAVTCVFREHEADAWRRAMPGFVTGKGRMSWIEQRGLRHAEAAGLECCPILCQRDLDDTPDVSAINADTGLRVVRGSAGDVAALPSAKQRGARARPPDHARQVRRGGRSRPRWRSRAAPHLRGECHRG